MPINAAWHQAHPMPPRATFEERARWHLEHVQVRVPQDPARAGRADAGTRDAA